ncbi:membrane protein [Marinobacterium zhoushanense]|uniref:Membrane protein n=1 Tax=Marinobacterium zhoushanense TaxID=1679163 RepID=A0ABQ1K653_9GAMM|nr:DUF2269 domain-containing protein [Marinobacterium zhoushanense]GGB86688.1 membrane protein [Marinobacterium zhoushanense]
MSVYVLVKIIHILSASVLFGTGMGIAFFMLRAHLSGEKQSFISTSRAVVAADWLFTTPAVLVQLLTGLWLTHQLHFAYSSAWFVSVIGLFILVGLCWLPVVWIQLRLSRLAESHHGSPEYQRLMRLWIGLGIPAFLAMLVIFYLMVTKAGVGITLFN